MLQETIANYISFNAPEYAIGESVPNDGSKWSEGVDIFLHYFPEGYEEGIIIKYGDNNIKWKQLSRTSLKIVVAWFDYITSRNKTDTILYMMNDNRGSLDGSWCVTNDLYAEEFGQDDEGRYVFVIEMETKYDYNML